MKTNRAFEVMSKRRKGYPSETGVKPGIRIVHGDKELSEKLGRNDPCPCNSGRRFQTLLHEIETVRRSTEKLLLQREGVGDPELERSLRYCYPVHHQKSTEGGIEMRHPTSRGNIAQKQTGKPFGFSKVKGMMKRNGKNHTYGKGNHGHAHDTQPLPADRGGTEDRDDRRK